MKIWVWFVVLGLLFASGYAQNFKEYAVEYDIILDKAIVDLTVTFDQFHSQTELVLPLDASAIEVSDGLQLEVEGLENAKQVVVKGKLFNTFHLKYITGSVIEKTRDRFFILDLGPISAEKISVTVKLPEQATLKYSLDAPQPSIIPTTEKIRTDGKRIIVQWKEGDLGLEKSILIIYTIPSRVNLLMISIIVISVVVGGIGVGVYYVYIRKDKRKYARITKKKYKREAKKMINTPSSSSELTRNLFEDERKVMEVLLEAKGNELWQKELALKSGLSKVKLSRKLRNLEQKGLIEKIPYGNTNKIRVKKADN